MEIFSFDPYLFLQAFFLLFSILNAVGNAPIFLSLTADMADKRQKIITESIFIAFVILIVFAYLGWFIFQLLGTTIDDFKIAGGIILFIIAYDYLRGEASKVKRVDAREIAAFPLATPLLAGPGAISTVMILMNPPYGPLITSAVIISNCLLAWIILRQGKIVQRILGKNGTRVFTRIMGLLIAAIAITFVREGIMAIIG
ncbi:MAG: MarC family protein [Candidatus Methylarchaceae archaeon HK01B]|nr:MarC family protein [Candidatus Methylarchaceae archaeon HK01M]MCP8312176.1 MarC family protein [Candidatus Methylarchaceae archaeon HK02M1]MCP8318858.1 MarC family protein [Candidatus Methylarchaceae archaeon HK01B]